MRFFNVGTYVDNNGTTPVDPRVKEAILPYLGEKFGNASTLYGLGSEAREAIEGARENLAKFINAKPEEVVFTGCGSESNNTALKCAISKDSSGTEIITSAIEHDSVLRTCRQMEVCAKVTYLKVDEEGFISLEELEKAVNKNTRVVSIMLANNEIGTIEPVQEAVKIVKDIDPGVLVHTDAVQALGKIPIDVKKLGVDLMSLSGHKIYAPKGVGALYIKAGVKIDPLIHGGAQENNRRAGTENVPGIVGFGRACELVQKEMEHDVKSMRTLQKRLLNSIPEKVNNTLINGPAELGKRLPGNVSFCFKYIEGESLVMMLDAERIYAGTGSACASHSLEPSHVLLAIGRPHEVAHGSLRIGVGRFNTMEDVETIEEKLPPIVQRLREMSPYKGL